MPDVSVPNYGLLSGLADGLKQGLLTYQTTKNIQNQRQMEGAMHGLVQDENGNWGPNAAKQAQMQLEQDQTARAQHGLISTTPESENARAIARGAFRQSNPTATDEQVNSAIPDTMAAQDIKDYGSNFVKPTIAGGYVVQGNQIKSETSEKNAKAKNKTTIEAAEIGAKKAKDVAGINANEKHYATDTKATTDQKKIDAGAAKADEKRWGLLSSDLDPNKARGGNLAASQKMINAADRVHQIFNQFPDGNIPETQTMELATAVASLISGGSPQSQAQINHIIPQSAMGSIENIKSFIDNIPRGKQQQEFIRVLRDSSERERTLAVSQVHGAQAQRLPQYEDLAKKDRNKFNTIVGGYGFLPSEFDESGHYTGQTQGQVQMAPAAQTAAPADAAAKLKRLQELKAKAGIK